MGHDHHHHHHGAGSREGNVTRLAWTLAITAAYMVAEIIGGYLADSLALLADAGHMFSDVAALALGLFAAWISRRPATPRHSYGYHRAEILAALANGATLIAIAILIFIEAVKRFSTPEPVQGGIMLGVAAGGLLANLLGMAILHGGKSTNLNMHGAWLHLLSDALGSVAALVAGVLILQFGWYWVDPLASILIGVLVIYSSWNLLKQAVLILMETAPPHIDTQAVEQAMHTAAGVTEVHDLHIWTITSGMESLSAHVVIDERSDSQQVLLGVRKVLHDTFGIDHITIQIETPGQHACGCSF